MFFWRQTTYQVVFYGRKSIVVWCKFFYYILKDFFYTERTMAPGTIIFSSFPIKDNIVFSVNVS